jgi:hypothetical protein
LKWMLTMFSSVPHCGGVGKGEHADELLPRGRWRRSCDTSIRATSSAAFACLPTILAYWWPSSSPATIPGVLATSRRRPCAEFVAAVPVFSPTSGVVPVAGEDGRTLCFVHIGGDTGRDGVFQILSKVFNVNSRVLFAFSYFCWVLAVIIPVPLN